MVCLFWCVFFVVRLLVPPKDFVSSAEERRVGGTLVLFYLAAAILYTDHWLFFSGVRHPVCEWSYMIVNLLVYPLYYAYLRTLTRAKKSKELLILLLPAVIVSVLPVVALVPRIGQWGGDFHLFARACFAIQVVYVWVQGYRLLKQARERMDNNYSDDRSHLLNPVNIVLHLFGGIALMSMVLNMLGREFFTGGLLVLIPAVLMSLLLYGLGFTAAHTYLPEETVPEEDKHSEGSESGAPQANRIAIIDELMEREHLYLRPELTIQELAVAAGTNRTYVSVAIHEAYDVNFATYVNHFRVASAKRILKDPTYKLDKEAISNAIALSGFTTEQTFYRVFKEMEGITPLQYRQSECLGIKRSNNF